MPYLAHVGIILDCDYSAYKKEHWYTYLNRKNFEIRWRFRNDFMYEVAAGPFCDRYEALKVAKYLFVTLLINFLYKKIPVQNAGLQFYEHRLYWEEHEPYAHSVQEFNETEAFFFWNPKYHGDELGIGVYEIPNYSFEEISIYDPPNPRPIEKAYMFDDADKLCFNNLEGVYFSFDREIQTVFVNLFEAEKSSDYGYKAEKYCGILEQLAPSYDKEQDVIAEINELIKHVQHSSLSEEQKQSIKNYLNSGKKMSSNQKCKKLVEEFGKDSYCSTDAKQILKNTYAIRSKYSHGENCRDENNSDIAKMKYLILDVIINYYRKKESSHV